MKVKFRWPPWFLAVGGILGGAALVTIQVVYARKFFREGDSIRINFAYQQPVLLSSTIVAMAIIDILLLAVLVRAFVQWRQQRHSPKK